MLLRRATAIATGKSRGHGRIARFKFIDVRAEGPTMVARLPQQVLLLLVLVTGASAEVTGETEDPRWSTYSARKTSRSSSPRSWPSSSLEHAARETRLSSGKHPETTPWGVDRSSPGARSDLSFLETVTERSEEDEDGRVQSPRGNDTGDAKIARRNQSISSRSDETNQTDPSNRISVESSSPQSSAIGYRPMRTSSSGSSYNIVPTLETRLSIETFSREKLKNTTPTATSAKNVTVSRRHMRHAPGTCDMFQVGDDTKKEFYSPDYPKAYPNHIECVRVLEADKGMLLKLDFRDKFKIEDSPDCHFDYLEIRDGKYGFSNLLGNFCGPNFPPEITSKTRYLWLRFHSDDTIEDEGFRAVWSMIPRPTHLGVPPEQEPCIYDVTNKTQEVIKIDDVLKDKKNLAKNEGVALDCMWIFKVYEGWKVQLTFEDFNLQQPNECEANVVDIFEDNTDMSSMKKHFCGSIADIVVITSNLAYMRFYVEPKAINSSFKAVMTAVRDKKAGDTACKENEYDCEDSTCIDVSLQCNGEDNCRFRWDENNEKCNELVPFICDPRESMKWKEDNNFLRKLRGD